MRSGGHSPLGHSTNTGGMVIDLSHLDAVDVLDADRCLVRVGGGSTWGKVAAVLEPYGWALTSGDTADVGVGGLTLGGGMGWMVRRHGLAIDNLVGAAWSRPTADWVTASADENSDLFWALRGGGGNFGVVVDFDFVAQPVARCTTGRSPTRSTIRPTWSGGGGTRCGSLRRSCPAPWPCCPDARCPADGEPAGVLRRRTGQRRNRRRRGHRADARARNGDPGQHRRARVCGDPGGGAASPAGVRLVGRNALVPILGDA